MDLPQPRSEPAVLGQLERFRPRPGSPAGQEALAASSSPSEVMRGGPGSRAGDSTSSI